MDRRLMLKAALGAAVTPAISSAAWAAEPDHDVTFLNDFDELWETLRDRYCFFSDKRTDWNRVRSLYRPLARSAESDDAFGEVLRRTLAELYDPHTSLADPARWLSKIADFGSDRRLAQRPGRGDRHRRRQRGV